MNATPIGFNVLPGRAPGAGQLRPLGPGRGARDFRESSPLAGTGVIADRVMVKMTPTSPEVPFAAGRVWLLQRIDGRKVWEGWSNADGDYTATGLTPGVEYIAVGIDPAYGFQATATGPVIAEAVNA